LLVDRRSSCVTLTRLVLAVCALLAASRARATGPDRAQEAAERFAKSEVVKQKNCVICHTIGASGGTVGPNLNHVASRRTLDWLRTWLRDPNAVRPGTKMPNFRFAPEEVEAVVGYLKDMKRPVDAAGLLGRHSDPVAAGEALFNAYDCLACHRIGDEGRFIGPNLTWVGVRKSREWERTWLRDPPAYKPGTFMPNFRLAPEAIDALTAFLHSLQGQANDKSRKWESTTSFILGSRPRERGRMVAERLACWACHGEDLSGGVRNPNAAPDETVPGINSAFLDLGGEMLKKKILEGSDPAKLAAGGEAPPFSCPAWKGAVDESEIKDLVAYLESIVPESAKWEFR